MHYKKEFWQKALVFVSKDGAMTKADVQYLEHLALMTATEAKRFSVEDNKQMPKAPNLSEHQKDGMDEFFDDIRFLTSFIGCNIFDIVKSKGKHLFYTTIRGCNAKGFYDVDGFTVLRESLIARDYVPSFNWKEGRAQLINAYTKDSEKGLVLESDKTFSSPSKASDFCGGRNSNGWITWKDEDGQTLDDVYRKQIEK